MKNQFNMKKLTKKMTREEFLNKVNLESWCVSKYGLDRIGCTSANDDEDESCNNCFKKVIKDFKFKGEIKII